MLRTRLTLLLLSLLLCAGAAQAVMIGFFPGMDKLIEQADNIVILRIDRQVTPYDSLNQIGTYDCLILQTLKGEIPAGKNIQLQLRDTRHFNFAPHEKYSTHLMFLSNGRSLSIMGANIRLSPLGHEKMPAGETTKERINSLLQSTIAYNQQQLAKEQEFLKLMIKGDPDTESLKRAVKSASFPTNFPPAAASPQR
ncbi:MAG: hypothetical protein ACO1QS_13475 [Verrucomicrobiota bacterium]